jgi:hypothetical protein
MDIEVSKLRTYISLSEKQIEADLKAILMVSLSLSLSLSLTLLFVSAFCSQTAFQSWRAVRTVSLLKEDRFRGKSNE